MADQEEPRSLSSTFPNPPPFWRDFTPERIARIAELRREHNGGGKGREGIDEPVKQIPGLSDDLANLQPPPEPEDGRWRVFGDQYMLDDKLPTLEEQGITNLPATLAPSAQPANALSTHHDRALELKRLAKSLLLNFLELTGTLSRSPADADAKVQDLRTLFINAHHALNEYRPHQARESAIEMMQESLDRVRAETIAVRSQVDGARRVLEGLGSLRVKVEEDKEMVDEEDEDAVAARRDAEVWAATDAVFA